MQGFLLQIGNISLKISKIYFLIESSLDFKKVQLKDEFPDL